MFTPEVYLQCWVELRSNLKHKNILNTMAITLVDLPRDLIRSLLTTYFTGSTAIKVLYTTKRFKQLLSDAELFEIQKKTLREMGATQTFS